MSILPFLKKYELVERRHAKLKMFLRLKLGSTGIGNSGNMLATGTLFTFKCVH
jgi:hypothetical protein